ncbi:hypothetical protein RHSIM_Rhsim03G0179700 [Rhododendron simsii]|uniref:Uncharacterized protein n=1 Tax=Rhododendron simsii TaxID=118357 RepID=A0A834HCK7_RHOSS|nr:hypothetical protein RHSIM_Rhsim03G0179700 [Rhododendron simsii]
MGGGGDHGHHGDAGDFRTKVWTMTGGPNCRPKHWKRNTAIAMAGVFLICIPIAMKSAELEVIPFSISLSLYPLSVCELAPSGIWFSFSKDHIISMISPHFVLDYYPGYAEFSDELQFFDILKTFSFLLLQQRPHHPVRPIPSQIWCKNFGKKEY